MFLHSLSSKPTDLCRQLIQFLVVGSQLIYQSPHSLFFLQIVARIAGGMEITNFLASCLLSTDADIVSWIVLFNSLSLPLTFLTKLSIRGFSFNLSVKWSWKYGRCGRSWKDDWPWMSTMTGRGSELSAEQTVKFTDRMKSLKTISGV